MKIGFISLAVPGHFNPTSAVARQLQSRNHDVVMLSLPSIEPLARALNLPFSPFGEKEFSAEQSHEIVGKLSRLQGEEGLQFTIDAIAQITKVKWRELRWGSSFFPSLRQQAKRGANVARGWQSGSNR
jgi:UDP:flavonoid glycosyltransferase YjiC (YdhE family)